MLQFGLIGKTLSHSYSPFLHEQLGDTPYDCYALDEDAFAEFMKNRLFSGVNITIPYKQAAIKYCTNLDETAREIGAVNTLVNEDGALYGYNTDVAGLSLLVRCVMKNLQQKRALILGDGGTARTARYVLKKMGISQMFVASRTPNGDTISYEMAKKLDNIHLLINTTPVGMYPNNGELVISPTYFQHLEGVVDVVYNPAKTTLILEAEKLGIPAIGGLAMLAEQARAASALFLKKEQPLQRTAELCTALWKQTCNLVLIGMPGCGKTSLGRLLAQKMERQFVDMDLLLEEQEGRSAKNIIEADGEAAFRDIESRIAKQVGKQNGQVISTGGGVILRQENIDALRQNGLLIWVDCPLEQLAVGNHRPLSRNINDLKELESQRRPLYENAADVHFHRPPHFQKSIENLTEVVLNSLHQTPNHFHL